MASWDELANRRWLLGWCLLRRWPSVPARPCPRRRYLRGTPAPTARCSPSSDPPPTPAPTATSTSKTVTCIPQSGPSPSGLRAIRARRPLKRSGRSSSRWATLSHRRRRSRLRLRRCVARFRTGCRVPRALASFRAPRTTGVGHICRDRQGGGDRHLPGGEPQGGLANPSDWTATLMAFDRPPAGWVMP